MFRKPMRLEKWIAFDGAVPVDAAQAVAVADDAVDPVDHHADEPDSHDDAFDSHTEQDSDNADEANDNDDIESFALMALSDEIDDPFKDEFGITYTKDDGTTATATGKIEIPDTISTGGKDLDDGFFAFRDGAVFQSGTGSSNMAQGQDFFFEIAPPMTVNSFSTIGPTFRGTRRDLSPSTGCRTVITLFSPVRPIPSPALPNWFSSR